MLARQRVPRWSCSIWPIAQPQHRPPRLGQESRASQASARHLWKSRYTFACCIKLARHQHSTCGRAGTQLHFAQDQFYMHRVIAACRLPCHRCRAIKAEQVTNAAMKITHLKAMQCWLVQTASLCRTVRSVCNTTRPGVLRAASNAYKADMA